MKKALLWGGGILILLIVIGAMASGGSKTSNTDTTTNNEATNSNTDTSGSTQAPTQSSAKEKITLSNATAKDKGFGMWEVVGEATNNDSTKHSFTLKATFYDANGKILGTAVGAMNDLEPGDTKTYSLVSTDQVTGYKEMKVQIDTLIL
jgi:hypothetical protein